MPWPIRVSCVAHALLTPDDENIHYSEYGPSGVMVMDAQGVILYPGREARQLLALACHPHLTLDARQISGKLFLANY